MIKILLVVIQIVATKQINPWSETYLEDLDKLRSVLPFANTTLGIFTQQFEG